MIQQEDPLQRLSQHQEHTHHADYLVVAGGGGGGLMEVEEVEQAVTELHFHVEQN
jgi:predicted Rossmann-fold nucleotide-binding protein